MKKELKVIIIGAGTKRRDFQQKEGWEVWGLNAIRYDYIKFDRMFNFHMRKHLEEGWEEGLIIDILWANKNKNIPFYVCDKWKDVPSTIIFPREKMKFGRYNYHCGSFDWMIAFAIYEGAKEIELHGINLVFEWGEPISARACLEYWCGYAEAKGIKITTKNCFIFHPYQMIRTSKVYGYDHFNLIEDWSNK